MEFCRITSAEEYFFEEAFALYEDSFPKYEQRTLDAQKEIMPNPLYHFDVIVEGTVVLGIILYWQGSGYVYVEHFAIKPEMRGNELGSKVLRVFCGKNPQVILEIDPPVDDISIRRENFYKRIGFMPNGHKHIHPAYQKKYQPHELIIMTYPRQISKDEYKLFKRELEEIVMRSYTA